MLDDSCHVVRADCRGAALALMGNVAKRMETFSCQRFYRTVQTVMEPSVMLAMPEGRSKRLQRMCVP